MGGKGDSGEFAGSMRGMRSRHCQEIFFEKFLFETSRLDQVYSADLQHETEFLHKVKFEILKMPACLPVSPSIELLPCKFFMIRFLTGIMQKRLTSGYHPRWKIDVTAIEFKKTILNESES